MEFKGKPEPYSEWGRKEISWSVQDENSLRAWVQNMNPSPSKPWVIQDGDHLFVEQFVAGRLYPILDAKVKFINARQASENPYYQHYVKESAGEDPKLSFGGVPVEYIPINVDLGVWFEIFLSETPSGIVATVSRD
jgi:hypothetical protein